MLVVFASIILDACTQSSNIPGATTTNTLAIEDIWDQVDPRGQIITFWHSYSKERETALLEIVDEFNKTNEWGITVVAEYQGSTNEIVNKMLALLNTPDAPDLVVAYQNNAAAYQIADALLDMNSLVESDRWGLSPEEQADFFPACFNQDIFPNFEHQRLGFPTNRSMDLLYYNADWLAELKSAGKIDFDGPPTTPNQFKSAACAATENPFSRSTVGGAIGYELSIDASRFASWTFAFGGEIFDGQTGQYTYNSEAAVMAMTFLQDLFKSGCAASVTESYRDQTDFGAGKLLFYTGSSSGLPFVKQTIDESIQFDWAVGELPHTTGDPAMNLYGASVSMPRTTSERELAAWLFLKYYTSAAAQVKWVEASNTFPVRASVAKGLGDYFETNPTYRAAFDLLKYARFEPPTPGYDLVRNKVGEAMAALMAEPYPEVEEILETLNKEANTILADQMIVVPALKPTTAP
jgi:multiple sugar transport system substrate-binding protein/sn-glycerol 3-phosphate transport system substrate-binding protein